MVVIMNDVTPVSYVLDGRYTIPDNGKLHKVAIAILPFCNDMPCNHSADLIQCVLAGGFFGFAFPRFSLTLSH